MKLYSNLIFVVALTVMVSGNQLSDSVSNAAENGMALSPGHDWAGTYRGVLPCASCEGISTELTLNKNKTYDLITRMIGKGDLGVRAVSGKFSLSKDGSVVILSGLNKDTQPTQYRIGENTLTQLDLTGNAITGDLADRYILTKGMPSLEEKYWKLFTLYGIAVTPEKGDRKTAHLMMKAEGNRVMASGGCNTISGDYVFQPEGTIRFSKLVATQMECPVMDTETQLLKVLETVDGYTIHGDTLFLHKAKMTPLVSFVATYPK